MMVTETGLTKAPLAEYYIYLYIILGQCEVVASEGLGTVLLWCHQLVSIVI